MKSMVAVLVMVVVIAQAASDESSVKWMLNYGGKSTNEVIRDKRAMTLIKAKLPKKMSDSVSQSLYGPSDPAIVVGDRFISISACRAHSCGEKGFFWIDTKKDWALGAYFLAGILELGSNDTTEGIFPPEATQALIEWITEQNLVTLSASFVGKNGNEHKLDAAQFQPKRVFQAPAAGPSFECAKASSLVEKAICEDHGLAKADLDLFNLYNEIRHGHDTMTAREQLRSLQRVWLKKRDRECSTSNDLKACIKMQYFKQKEALMNWVPAQGN